MLTAIAIARIGLRQGIEMKSTLLGLLLAVIQSISVAGNDAERYEKRGDEVLDKQSGLIWKRCSVGQRFEASGKCLGEATKFTFRQAQKLNSKHWTVPTAQQLKTLIDQTYTPTINKQVFPSGAHTRMYWSSDQYDDSSAWYADFQSGSVDHYYGDFDFLNERFAVRLVKVVSR